VSESLLTRADAEMKLTRGVVTRDLEIIKGPKSSRAQGKTGGMIGIEIDVEMRGAGGIEGNEIIKTPGCEPEQFQQQFQQ